MDRLEPFQYKGNKASLPFKRCKACGRPMSYRKAWAKNWDAVKYCSTRCRRSGAEYHPSN